MLTMLRTLLRIRRFPMVAEAAVALLRSYLSVRFRPFGLLAKELVVSPAAGESSGNGESAARAVRGAVGAVSRRLPRRPTCLVRAVAAHRMLARRGVGSTVVLSVAPNDGSMPLHAHAWLEAAGTVVTGARDMGAFTPIYRIGNEAGAVAVGDARCSR